MLRVHHNGRSFPVKNEGGHRHTIINELARQVRQLAVVRHELSSLGIRMAVIAGPTRERFRHSHQIPKVPEEEDPNYRPTNFSLAVFPEDHINLTLTLYHFPLSKFNDSPAFIVLRHTY